MRRLTHLCAGCALFALLGLLGWIAHARPQLLHLAPWYGSKLDQQKMALVAQAKISRAFVLPHETWLSFPIEVQQQDVRLVSTANISDLALARTQHLANPGRRWDYALEVELLDAGGKRLTHQILHHSANLLETRHADGSVNGAAFYLQENLTPLSSEVSNLRIDQAAQMRVRRLLPAGAAKTGANAGAEIADVVLRVYQARAVSAQESSHRWQRLSAQQQEELARAAVHDKALLQEQEKQNLLRNTRSALGPGGQEGRDYQVRDLYVLHENEGVPQSAPIAPYGVLFDAQRYASIALPEQGGELRLEIGAAPQLKGGAGVASGEISWRWFGAGLFQKSSSTLAWHGSALQHSMQVKGGLLELQGPCAASDGSCALTVRAFLKEQGKEREITPQPQYERSFIARHDSPLSFTLSDSASLSGLRLSVRSFASGALQPTRAHYAAFDAQGQQLGEGELAIPAIPAHYERVVGDFSQQEATLLHDAAAPNNLSEVVAGYFVLPQKAAQLKVWADSAAAPLLVAAHTRPYALARELHLPDDHYSFDALGKRIPAWFILPPQDEEQLLIKDRSRQLLLQSRPLEESPEQQQILQGAFQWQDYRPRGNWLARPIYTPRDAEIAYRPEVLPSTFTPLALGRTQQITLPDYQGVNVLTPTLVWLGAAQAARLEIMLDGQPFYQLAVRGPYAEYNLPAIPAARHQISLKASQPGQVYLNHLLPNQASLVRRIGQRFTQELVFDYERSSATAETLSARLYQIGATAQAAPRIRVRIEGPPPPVLKPLSAWVFAERIASVRRAPEQGKVFDTEGQVSDGGSPIYLPFPADAPLGHYRIHLSVDAGGADKAAQNRHYVSLSLLSAALKQQRRVHHQTEISHVNLTE